MTSTLPVWDPAAFRARVQGALDAFLDEQGERLAPLGADAARLLAEARASVSGGKRFRAAFCYWGYHAVAGPADLTDDGTDDGADDALVRACASLELLHASALVHDDYMDASDTRRGRPATHRGFEVEHRADGWRIDHHKVVPLTKFRQQRLHPRHPENLMDRRVRCPGDHRVESKLVVTSDRIFNLARRIHDEFR